jgi:alpha-galactosidase
VEVWFKPLAGGNWAMCALNRGPATQKISCDWKNEKVFESFWQRDAQFSSMIYDVKDLWTQKPLGNTQAPLAAEIPGHDVRRRRHRKK